LFEIFPFTEAHAVIIAIQLKNTFASCSESEKGVGKFKSPATKKKKKCVATKRLPSQMTRYQTTQSHQEFPRNIKSTNHETFRHRKNNHFEGVFHQYFEDVEEND
jgi:hypothetical protein